MLCSHKASIASKEAKLPNSSFYKGNKTFLGIFFFLFGEFSGPGPLSDSCAIMHFGTNPNTNVCGPCGRNEIKNGNALYIITKRNDKLDNESSALTIVMSISIFASSCLILCALMFAAAWIGRRCKWSLVLLLLCPQIDDGGWWLHLWVYYLYVVVIEWSQMIIMEWHSEWRVHIQKRFNTNSTHSKPLKSAHNPIQIGWKTPSLFSFTRWKVELWNMNVKGPKMVLQVGSGLIG